jgi:hypothetical protein
MILGESRPTSKYVVYRDFDKGFENYYSSFDDLFKDINFHFSEGPF